MADERCLRNGSVARAIWPTAAASIFCGGPGGTHCRVVHIAAQVVVQDEEGRSR